MLPTLFAIFFSCMLLERAFPGWPLPRVKTWPLRVVLINVVQLGVVMLAGITWEVWLSSWSIWHLGAHTDVAGPCMQRPTNPEGDLTR